MLLSICWAPQLLPKGGSPAGKKEKSRDRDATGKRVARERNAYFQRESFHSTENCMERDSQSHRHGGSQFSLSSHSTFQQQQTVLIL